MTASITCPACGAVSTQIVQTHSVADAAAHLVSPRRSPARHAQLLQELHGLWGGDEVRIRRCEACSMQFADPFRAGTPEIYNLITAGDESYPADRFEFRRTLREPLIGRLLEVGAGDGAFLRRAATSGRFSKLVATEYDEGSAHKLRTIPGVTVYQDDIQTLAETMADGSFEVICMFQVLEHMDRIDEAMRALRYLLVDNGRAFISVPNPDRIDLQERFTGLWDMPPNHVGRWTRGAMDAAARSVGLRTLDYEVESQSRYDALWNLAKFRFRARGYDPKTVAGRTDAISDRRVRGLVKRSLTLWDAAMVAGRLRGRDIPGAAQWFMLGPS